MNQKYYVVSEEELRKIAYCISMTHADIDVLLKSKQPVELLRECKMDSRSYMEVCDSDGSGIVWDNFGERKIKNIKIYIEVQNDKTK